MQVKQVISMVVQVALVVIIGFLIIGMIQLFVQKDGVVYNFFKNTTGLVVEKSNELIDGVLEEDEEEESQMVSGFPSNVSLGTLYTESSDVYVKHVKFSGDTVEYYSSSQSLISVSGCMYVLNSDGTTTIYGGNDYIEIGTFSSDGKTFKPVYPSAVSSNTYTIN